RLTAAKEEPDQVAALLEPRHEAPQLFQDRACQRVDFLIRRVKRYQADRPRQLFEFENRHNRVHAKFVRFQPKATRKALFLNRLSTAHTASESRRLRCRQSI